MRQPISTTRRNHIIPSLVNLLRNLHRMAHIRRPFDIDLTLCGGENRLDVPRVPFRGFAGPAVRVDEDLDALIALGFAVGAVEEAGDPGRGEGGGGAGGGVEGVVYVGDADGGLGGGFCVVDCQVDLGEGGPEDVEKGDGASGLGLYGDKEVSEYLLLVCREAVVRTDAKGRGGTYLKVSGRSNVCATFPVDPHLIEPSQHSPSFALRAKYRARSVNQSPASDSRSCRH
jgi:hypothetical protein